MYREASGGEPAETAPHRRDHGKKELEGVQTMSAFLIHDLKNAASTLGLMLENLPTHFNNPAFREDAFRGIGSAASRINDLITA